MPRQRRQLGHLNTDGGADVEEFTTRPLDQVENSTEGSRPVSEGFPVPPHT